MYRKISCSLEMSYARQWKRTVDLMSYLSVSAISTYNTASVYSYKRAPIIAHIHWQHNLYQNCFNNMQISVYARIEQYTHSNYIMENICLDLLAHMELKCLAYINRLRLIQMPLPLNECFVYVRFYCREANMQECKYIFTYIRFD